MHSTGRGGAGNVRYPPRKREATGPGPEDYSDTRGRDPIPANDPHVVASTGRGGAGNIRSPSRAENGSPKKFTRSHPRGRVYERDLLAFIDNAYNTGMHSLGRGPGRRDRGGVGNMTSSLPNSQSRCRSREPAHAAGRGGMGNMYIGGPTEKIIEELDESERATHQHLRAEGVHSPGRGGFGNLVYGEVPHREGARNRHRANHPHATHSHDAESFGRGGSGNISRDPPRKSGAL
ncbi:hypothetical protein DFH94DRAFT_755029 [Russula ochroleuca]|uniref:Uncharacterized protein n=1 Tax=Russula ochroleuca TaxID=152965 RepID=A0A9P5MSN5_9AGAM|nr:hypothetical protein DFH94DRAFT_755029 [Russula ochroleuca]